MRYTHSIPSLLAFSACFFWFHLVNAQIENNFGVGTKDNSPYSYFGVGDLLPNYSVGGLSGNYGMTAAGYFTHQLNPINPASSAFLKVAAVDIGLYGRYNARSSGSNNNYNWSGNVTSLAVGFALKNELNKILDKKDSPWDYGLVLALTPTSQAGYNISNSGIDQNHGGFRNNFKGRGGTYRFTSGFGAKYKNFSSGISLGYNFGSIISERVIRFDSIRNGYNAFLLDEVSVQGVHANLGFMYDFILNENKDNPDKSTRLTVGAYGTPPIPGRANSYALYQRVSQNVNLLDTITNTSQRGVRSNITQPSEFGVGFVYAKPFKFKLGLNYTRRDFSSLDLPNRSQKLGATDLLAVSFEYIPDYNSFKGMLYRSAYRVGGFYSTDYRATLVPGLKEYGVSVGMGLPITPAKRPPSYVNLGLEYSRTASDSGIQGQHYRIVFTTTLTDDYWFFKPRYN
jgi:hypothetical protein